MRIRPVLSSVAAIALAAALGACGTSKPPASATSGTAPQAGASSSPGSAKPVPVQPVAPVTAGKPGAAAGAGAHPLDAAGSALAKRSVFYEFDKSDIAAEYRGLVEAHARYVRDNPVARVTVEGNCDERGSREYNLALGQRRAEGVKKAMVLLGAREAQVEAVSFGEEKPRAAGSGEAAWSQNRRSDITYIRRP